MLRYLSSFAAVLAILSTGLAHADESGSEPSELARLSAEVAALSSQNTELITALRDQLQRFEQQQAVVDTLAQRVAELEQQPEAPAAGEITFADIENANRARALSPLQPDRSITFGGWAGFAYTDNSKPGTKPGFDAHPLYFYAQAQPTPDWKFFGEIEIEHLFGSNSSGTQGEFRMERLYIEKEFANASKARLGKFFLPFGYWYQMHWHFLTETLSRPISFNNAYVPRQQVGIEYLNTAQLGETHVSYYAWLGNGPDLFGTDHRTESAFSIGASAFAEQTLSHNAKIGATVGVHQQTEDAQDQLNFVAGGTISVGPIDLRAEHYWHQRDTAADFESSYLSAQFNTSETFGFVYRFDFGDDLKSSKDPFDPSAQSHSFGFLWRPQPQLLFKGEYRLNAFDSPGAIDDFNSWNVFSAIKF